jgi:ABC-2 type transport system permease protein
MIRKIFSIAFLYLRTTYSSLSTLIFSIAMPLIFTLVLGVAMMGLASDEPPAVFPLLVVDEDHSIFSENLIEKLDDNPLLAVRMTDESSARAAVDANDAAAALFIPSGFGANVIQLVPVDLTFLQSAEAIPHAQILLEAVNAANTELEGSVAIADLSLQLGEAVMLIDGEDEAVSQAYWLEAFEAAEKAWDTGEAVAVRFQDVTRLETSKKTIPLGANQSSPGMLVMFVLFFTFGGAATLLVEREEGTLRRLLVMPMGRGVVLTGKLLGVFFGALLQMLIMILFGAFVLGLEWGRSPLALALMLVAYAFASTTLGLLVASLAKTVAQADSAGMIIVMVLASLGGTWWPIEIVPVWMQKVAFLLPTGWAMRGFQDIIVRGLNAQAILLEASVLLGFGAVFLVAGILCFRYE